MLEQKIRDRREARGRRIETLEIRPKFLIVDYTVYKALQC